MLRKHGSVIRSIFALVLIGTAFYFLAGKVRTVWVEISAQDFEVRAGWLLFSYFALCFAFYWFAFGWNHILRYMEYTVDSLTTSHIWYKAQVSKYVPGFVWNIVGRASWGSAVGIPWEATVLSSAVEMTLMVIGAALLSSVLVFQYVWRVPVVRNTQNYLLLLPVLLILLLPKLLDAVLRVAGQEQHDFNLRFPDSLRLLTIYVFRWVFAGIAFVFLVKALYSVRLDQWYFLVSSFSLAWLVGFVTLFAPGGIGVREAVLVWLLESTMPTGTALLVALLARLWWIAGEVTMLLATTVLSAQRRVRVVPNTQE